MFGQSSPWLRSARVPMLMAMVPAVVLIGALIVFTVWAIVYSFTDIELIGPKQVNWSWIGLENYERLITRRGFLESLWTTIVFTFFSAIVGQCVLGFVFAQVMRGIRSRARNVLEVAIMLGWLLPDVVAAFLWSATSNDTGIVNAVLLRPLGIAPINFLSDYALPVVIIANVWKGTAWSYLLFTAALDSVSREVSEAARVDGASVLQRIWFVTLPIIRPHIATNMLFITIWTFTYFPLIYALTGGGPGRQTQVLSIFMYQQSFSVGKLGFGSAISVAMVLIVGVLSIFYIRMLREPK